MFKRYEKYGKYGRKGFFFYKTINTACNLFKFTLCLTVRGNNSVSEEVTYFLNMGFNIYSLANDKQISVYKFKYIYFPAKGK
jgi:hypothetical protein